MENNIGFAINCASEEKIKEAAANAVVQNEIEQFSQKYKTIIGERGVTLSGGQKQRISIARALMKEHEIVIFDDCLSAVDAKTESQIINKLDSFLKNKTAIIITHRIFSLFNFDRIILLKDGAVAEQGTHSELLNKNGYYAEMYAHQQKTERKLAADSSV